MPQDIYEVLRMVLGQELTIIRSTNPGIDSNVIQQALDNSRQVILSGSYNIDRTLVVPPTSRLLGTSETSLSWWGEHEAPMIHCPPGQRTSAAIANIALACRNRSQGIHFEKIWYSPLFENVVIYDGIHDSLHFEDCWGGHGRGLKIGRGTGRAIKFTRENSVQLDNVNVSSRDIKEATSLIDIPSDLDLLTINNLCMEANATKDKPLITAAGAVVTLTNVRFEGNDTTDSLIHLTGDGYRSGCCFTVKHCRVVAPKGVKHLIHLLGHTKVVKLTDIMSLYEADVIKSIAKLIGEVTSLEIDGQFRVPMISA